MRIMVTLLGFVKSNARGQGLMLTAWLGRVTPRDGREGKGVKQGRQVCSPTGLHRVQLNECSVLWGYEIETENAPQDSWTREGKEEEFIHQLLSPIGQCPPQGALATPFPTSLLCRSRYQAGPCGILYFDDLREAPGLEAMCYEVVH